MSTTVLSGLQMERIHVFTAHQSEDEAGNWSNWTGKRSLPLSEMLFLGKIAEEGSMGEVLVGVTPRPADDGADVAEDASNASSSSESDGDDE